MRWRSAAALIATIVLVSLAEYGTMIRQVERCLRGKTRDLLQELNSKMQQEAEQLKFEQAARLRDQIKLIENYYFTSQKVELTDLEDRDVIALALEEQDGCVVVFKIRDGKVIGRQHFYLQRVEEKSPPEVLSHFLQQYYLEAEYYPSQLLLPDHPAEEPLIRQWLQKQAGENIELTVPQQGEKRKLLELCQKNARFLLDELLLQKDKRKEVLAYNIKILQKDLQSASIMCLIITPPMFKFRGTLLSSLWKIPVILAGWESRMFRSR